MSEPISDEELDEYRAQAEGHIYRTTDDGIPLHTYTLFDHDQVQKLIARLDASEARCAEKDDDSVDSSPVEPMSDEELDTWRGDIDTIRLLPMDRIIARIDAAEAELVRLRPVVAAAKEATRRYQDDSDALPHHRLSHATQYMHDLKAALDALDSPE